MRKSFLTFFAPQGRLVAPMGVKFGLEDAEFHRSRCRGGGIEILVYKRPAWAYSRFPVNFQGLWAVSRWLTV